MMNSAYVLFSDNGNNNNNKNNNMHVAASPGGSTGFLSPNSAGLLGSEPDRHINDFMSDTSSNVSSQPDIGGSLLTAANQKSWVDPYEPAIQDTFYHKELKRLRPNFDNIQATIQQIANDPAKEHLLLNDSLSLLDNDEEDNSGLITNNKNDDAKFGAWDGVFVGCILNIFGVIMFLRVGWIVGQAGVIQTIGIVLVSSSVTFLTTLSMSAICTNGTILSGGAYYIISRALGPAIGGSVGVMFSLGNMIAVSLYLIGFAETIVDNLGENIITGNYTNDVRIWSNAALLFALILALVGLKYVIKANLGLFVLIVCTIICFFAGSCYRTYYDNGEQVVYATAGWTNDNFITNLDSGYEDGYDFWSTLSIFFPAVTGIMAGANISGDLRDASHDIPLGTLTAVGVSTVIYCIMAVVVGAVAKRSELLDNYTIMTDIAVWDGIVLMGIYAATLSSGIAALVGAPRVLQAIAQDDIIPALKFFAKTDSHGNPVRGYILSFLVAAGCNCIGSLNFVAPLISEFFMIAYLMINFACFSLELSRSPGWRPSFTYFNKYSAFCGFGLCLAVMFLIDWLYAIIAIAIGAGIFLYIENSNNASDSKWGSAQQSRNYYEVYKALLRLNNYKHHTKNWRPAILCLTHDPLKKSKKLVYFCQTLRKGYGPLFFATIYNGDYRVNVQKFHELHHNGYLPYMHYNNSKTQYCKGFYETILSLSFRMGAIHLFQSAGVGSLRPNTIMIGYKNQWQEEKNEVVKEYVDVLRDALQMKMGLIVCVGLERIDWDHFEYQLFENNDNNNNEDDSKDNYNNNNGKRKPKNSINYGPSEVIRGPSIDLESNMVNGHRVTIIDVWWLLDDGGLCILLPHIMRSHSFWRDCKVRINLVIDRDDANNSNIKVIDQLIQKFRLPFESPARVILAENGEPSKDTVAKFERLSNGIKIEDTPRPHVTKKWLKLSEILYQHSRDSGLIIVTLPLPTAKYDAKAYMALLQCISDQRKMPPMLIMRGNGESSLTFYLE